MKRWISSFAFAGIFIFSTQPFIAKDNSEVLKQSSRNTISLELEFTKKGASSIQKFISSLNWGPNGYATGFLVRDRLVITAYHVVSGELDDTKKMALGFGRKDKLETKVYTNGCQAKVLKIDKEADLALLEICSSPKQIEYPSFETNVTKDEKVVLIARPNRDRIVSYGTFYGPYCLRGIDYWSIKIIARDGFSGSPIYNQQGEIVGVFSSYDWAQNVAIVSPGERVQKLLEEYLPSVNP